VSWRKWLIRGLVFAIVAGLATAAWLFQRWTNPVAVRAEVIEQLEEIFEGANVTLDSARLRLLSGISVTDVRMSRRDDPDRIDFFYIPSAIIYHDKEQLLNGLLAVRKVELHRPRLRIVRDRDGRWNLRGILGLVDPTKPLPTIVVQQGTIELEDHHSGRAVCEAEAPPLVRLEIQNVSFTLVNDPLPTLAFELKGDSDLAGAVQASGTWQRVSGATAVSVEAPAIRLEAPLVQLLAAYQPRLAEHARLLQGTARLQADCQYNPGAPQPWSHDFRCQLSRGYLDHPRLPLPLNNLEIDVRYSDGQISLDRLSADNGPTRLRLSGWARLREAAAASPKQAIHSLTPEPEELIPEQCDFEGDLKVERLPLAPTLFRRLPESLQEVQALFSPAGVIELSLQFSRKSGRWFRRARVVPADLRLSFVRFPYLLEKVQGSVDCKLDEAVGLRETAVNLVGYTGSRPVFIRGQVSGESPCAVAVDVWGEDIPLDDKLIAALPARYQQMARSFHPSGLGNFVAHIRRPLGRHDFDNRFVVQFHDSAIRFDVFPYPLEAVSGILDIQEDRWEFRDFHGSHKGGTVHCRGRSRPAANGNRVSIEIRGQDLLLDEELEAALQPKLREAWQAFRPAGRMSFVASIEDVPQEPRDIDVTVTVNGCALRPTFLPYRLDDVCGTVRYAKDQVYVGTCRARHGASVLSLEKADVQLKPGGGYYARLHHLKGEPIVPDDDLRAALPSGLRQTFETLQLRDPLQLDTLLIIDQPTEVGQPAVIYWDGGVTCREARLHVGIPLEKVTGQVHCRGRYNGRQLEGVVGNLLFDQVVVFKQPLQQVHSRIEIPRDAPDVLRLPNLKARIFGGDLSGEIRVEHGSTLRYDVNLTAMQVKLEEFGRHNFGADAQIQGQAMARLYLTGRGPGTDGLEGRGSIDIPSGKMYNLPILLDLVKVIGLRPPDRTAFEEAHASFVIRGSRVTVTRLDLYGHAISLSGQGEMNLDGTELQIDFYAVWGRIVQLLPPVLKELPPAIGQYLLKVKMRGRVGDVEFDKEPVPVLVEPIERLLKRLTGKNREAGKAKPAPPDGGLGLPRLFRKTAPGDETRPD
jgi:hypothetical protein